MTPPAFRLLRAALQASALVLVILAARRSREAQPVAWALAILAAVDLARLAPLPPWLDAALWCAWPGVPAALAWRVWRPRCDVAIVRPFAAYAVALLLAPAAWWRLPWLWSWATRAPYVAGPAVAILAWALRKDEGPGGEPEPFVRPFRVRDPRSERPTAQGASLPHVAGDAVDGDHPAPAHAAAQAVAAVLALSGGLDVAVGALATDGGPWWVAWATSAATWAVCGGILARCLTRSRKC